MSDNANMQKDGNKLQGFTKIWNGLPMVQFKKNFIIPLIVAMGNVVMDGVPLPDTILGVDHGGHANGAPNGTLRHRLLNAALVFDASLQSCLHIWIRIHQYTILCRQNTTTMGLLPYDTFKKMALEISQ